MPVSRSTAALDRRTCELICPIAAAMVGVCLTAIGILQVVMSVHRTSTAVDDVLSADALLFLAATLASYFALRVQGVTRLHWMEWIADKAFILAMIMLTGACFVITYDVNLWGVRGPRHPAPHQRAPNITESSAVDQPAVRPAGLSEPACWTDQRKKSTSSAGAPGNC